MSHRNNFLKFNFLSSFVAVMVLSSPSYANSLKVKVFSGGKPANGAYICLGTKQERTLFGIQVVNSEGEHVFEKLPEGKILITANAGTFGKELSILNNLNAQTVFVALPDEPSGPTCPETEL